MNLSQWLQLLLSGITTGAIYALVGLGYVTIYRTSRVVNFAQGSFVMLGSLFVIIIAELLNSAVEWTIDDISMEKRPFAKRAKDMGSAAVFLAYINCMVVWGVILYSNWHRIQTLEFLRWPPQFLQ